MKINKATLFLWGTVGILTVAITIVMIFGKEEKTSKVTQVNQTTTSQQQATHQEKPSTQQPQQKQQDPNTKDLETAGTKTDGISSNENEEIEKAKKITLDFFHLFNEKNLTGQEAEKQHNSLHEKIKELYSKEALKQYSPQDIAKYYENLKIYSFVGNGENSMLDLKLKDIQIQKVVFSKENNAYVIGIQITTKQNEMVFSVGLQKEDGSLKFMHVPDAKVVQIR
ncbi:hypothetical protein D0U04_21605 [Bacillus clarus]|uniref:Uncharacterized protein n=1 Tax=Bacillus clarus TaxID=2338372 RepID=A0A090Y7W2_9BACI|nr:hypothetical protein [Bacillus clarus]KFM94863.1 hypothetical protein DJ93_6021 [Bacillus clarus]RFT64478.1 hypothetical protein D0U04_21605 [Bacillus clarus]